jgi:Tol biopolymer transport system component
MQELGNRFGIAWSPDGGKIAFDQIAYTEDDVITDNRLWIMNADGSGATAITSYPSIRPVLPATGPAPVFSWAPDGSRLALAATTSLRGPGDIYLVRPDGTDLTNLTKQGYRGITFADWSPDGSRILFNALAGGRGDVFAMNADGGHITNLTNSPGDDRGGTWQP